MKPLTSLFVVTCLAWIAPVACAQLPPTSAFGFAVSPIGGATLSGTGLLMVTPTSPSSTPYGFSAALTDSEGFTVVHHDFDPTNSLPVGARMDVTSYAAAGAGASVAELTFRSEKTAGGIALSVIPGTSFQSGTVAAFLDGSMVASAPYVAGGGNTFATASAWPGGCHKKTGKRGSWSKTSFAYCYQNSPFGDPNRGEFLLQVGPTLANDGGVPISLTGLGVVIADALQLTSDPAPGLPPTRITSVDHIATNIPSFMMHSMLLFAYKAEHASVGNASLTFNSGQLTFASSGGPGPYGVDAGICPTNTFAAEWLDPDSIGPTPIGSTLTLAADGSGPGVPLTSLGSITVTKAVGALQLTADYSALGSPTQTVQLLNNGALAGMFSGQSGVLASFHNWPTRCGEVLGPPWHFFASWQYPVAVTVPGAPSPIVATEVRIVSEAPVSNGSIYGFRVRCTGLTSLTVINENPPVPTPPPFNLTASSPFGSGSLQLDFVAGPPNGIYFLPVTLTAGIYPSGWLFGLDISLPELTNLLTAGFPFLGPLDATGNFTLSVIGVPPGLTLYAVGLGAPVSGTPIVHTPAISYTIP
jgi:hypothetical protein